MLKMAANIMHLGFAFVTFSAVAISSPLDEQNNHLRIRRQFGTQDSSLQQTLNGLQGNRRPGQSGNNQGQSNGGFTSGSSNGQDTGGFISGSSNGQGTNNGGFTSGSSNGQGTNNGGLTSGSSNGQGQGFGNGQGQGFGNNQGQGFGNNQGQGFGNNQGQSSGNNQGQGSGNNQGQGFGGSSNSNGNNQGGSSSSSSTSSIPGGFGSIQGQGSGSSNTGNNQGGFVGGSQGQGSNQPTTVQNPYVTIVNTEFQLSNELVQCIRRCPSTSQFNPVCGSDNVTYTNEGRMRCAQQCGRRVTQVYRGSCVPSATTTPSTPIAG